MKKRNLAITAFVLCATLVMAIGFAALSGTLNITGTAYFHGTAVTSSDILAAVKFTDATAGDNCTVSIKDSALAASMDVIFRDTEGQPGTFTATATYEITYQSATETDLPDITFSVPQATITSAAGSPGFNIATDWSTAKTLAHGQKITITVTVTYTQQDPIETGTVSATIAIPMPYVTVEA